MNADTDIQVWLEAFSRPPPGIIIPYVKTARDRTLRYRVLAVKDGAAGRATFSQSGIVDLRAGVPAALGRLSVNHGPRDECHIALTLSEPGANVLNYHFACPTTVQYPANNYLKQQ
ncbi:MAG: curli-like amyloid fiber formation chaperone CsgH [Pusillimonas sp.]